MPSNVTVWHGSVSYRTVTLHITKAQVIIMTNTAEYVESTAQRPEEDATVGHKADANATPKRRHPLARYIIKRFFVCVLLVWGVGTITFFLTNVVPADPAAALISDKVAKSNPEIVAAIRHRMGLDQPLRVRYFIYFRNLLHGDLGTSSLTTNPVSRDLARAFPATLELSIIVFVLTVLISMFLGLLAAIHKKTLFDKIIQVFSLFSISMPGFWVAMIAFYIFFFRLHWFSGGGRLDSSLVPPPTVTGMYLVDSLLNDDPVAFMNSLSHIMLPALTLTFLNLGSLIRFCRQSAIEAEQSDYTLGARAKGLPFRVVTIRYVFRGASLPILNMTGLTFGALLSGAVLTETVFSWHGIGEYAYNAATSLDLNGIMGSGLLVGVIYIFINFFVDILCGILDPRVRVQ